MCRPNRLSLPGLLAALVATACGGTNQTAAPVVASVAPTTVAAPAGPPAPLESATVVITRTGFSLQASGVTVQAFRIYQGARLTFINNDIQPHDVMSDPFHVHTDCPPLNAVGFLTPGQSRTSDPLNTLGTCGFHDHDFEGNEAYHGFATIVAR